MPGPKGAQLVAQLQKGSQWALDRIGKLWGWIAGLASALIAALLALQNTSFAASQFFQILRLLLLSLGGLLLLTVVIWLLSLLARPLVKGAALRGYLANVIGATSEIHLRGVELRPLPVALEAVFISLRLLPGIPEADVHLDAQEREAYSRQLVAGNAEWARPVLASSARSWQGSEPEPVEIVDLWTRLTYEEPTAVILGVPGSGKSTLLIRLALYMARRCLGQKDAQNFSLPDPPLFPILLSINKYAGEDKEGVELPPLADYWPQALTKMGIVGSEALPMLGQRLKDGRCLLLFDGLDEISSQQTRLKVVEAIKAFIQTYRSQDQQKGAFNRFLITSRLAGYRQEYFPYPCYTLAKLTPEQMKDFLPRWCHAVYASQEKHVSLKKAHTETELTQTLIDAVETNANVARLAEVPFLLTLLATLQYWHPELTLPRDRGELYSKVVHTLLETRNEAQDLLVIRVKKAVRFLGPIAYSMQEKNSDFLSLPEAQKMLAQVVRDEQGAHPQDPAEIEQIAERFLEDERIRGGIFVLRTDIHLGFFHRSFQEYFAARHILNLIEADQTKTQIPALIAQARRQDDLWREPFLLALAYKGDEPITSIIFKALLDALSGNLKQRTHDLALAARCVVETRAGSIQPDLERLCMQKLLDVYEEAQRTKHFDLCQQLEVVVQDWLQRLEEPYFSPTVLTVWQEAIEDVSCPAHQRAALTLFLILSLPRS